MRSCEKPLNNELKNFPLLSPPRPGQLTALEFIASALLDNFRDIVIEAPTGVGKSAVGLTIAAEDSTYYLATQKILQRQLEHDRLEFRPGFPPTASITSAEEFECLEGFRSCAAGTRAKKGCGLAKSGSCLYKVAKAAFGSSQIGITNYQYFFNARTYAKLEPRKILVCDEAHSLERQLTNFVTLELSDDQVRREAALSQLPSVANPKNLTELIDYAEAFYLPGLRLELGRVADLMVLCDEDEIKLSSLEQRIGLVERVVSLARKNPREWIFWRDTNLVGPVYHLKPLYADEFARQLIHETEPIRLYMSAYLGSKKVFCHSLGLDPRRVAWLSLQSEFAKENRPIVLGYVGSMSRRNQEFTLPAALTMIEKILRKHQHEKGLIHGTSYKLSTAIFEFLKPRFGSRIIFPRSADERDAAFQTHKTSPDPTVILSPSFTEGFNFIGKLAEFQILPKVAYPSLGDAHVQARMKVDEAWYSQQTISTMIQACGRACRTPTDRTINYIIDSDFGRLLDQWPEMFPAWFTEALVNPYQ